MKISILWRVPWGSLFTAYKARRFRFRMSGFQSTFRIFGLNRGVGPFHTSHAPYCLTSKYSRSVTERLSLFASRTGPVVGTVVARHEEGNSVVQGERRKASADTDEREVRGRGGSERGFLRGRKHKADVVAVVLPDDLISCRVCQFPLPIASLILSSPQPCSDYVTLATSAIYS